VRYDLNGNATLFCNIPPVTLTVTKSGAGKGTVTSGSDIDCGLKCTRSYPPGTSVTLTAAPDAFSKLQNWSGGCTDTATTCTFMITTNVTVNASFSALPTATLTVTKAGTGTGTVKDTITNGLDCGTICTSRYLLGTVVQLQAFPTNDTIFLSEWGGACTGPAVSLLLGIPVCTLTINTNLTVSASFTQADLAIEAASLTHFSIGFVCSGHPPTCHQDPRIDWKGGTISGTISLGQLGTTVSCGNGSSGQPQSVAVRRCLFVVASGSTVSLTEVPDTGAKFVGWSGACTGTSTTCTFVKPGSFTTVRGTFDFQ